MGRRLIIRLVETNLKMEQFKQCENNLTRVLDIQNERSDQKWSVEVHRAYLNWLAFYLTYDLNKASKLL